MSHYKEYDYEYAKLRANDPNYDDPKWCAIEELEQRINAINDRITSEYAALSTALHALEDYLAKEAAKHG